MSGYCDTGRLIQAIAPTMVMITAMTAAKIGRVMKKRDRRMIPVPRRKRRKGRDLSPPFVPSGSSGRTEEHEPLLGERGLARWRCCQLGRGCRGRDRRDLA